PVTAKVTHHALSIRGTTRGRGAAFRGMKLLELFRRHGLVPESPAILPRVAMYLELVSVEDAQENSITPYHRRRHPAGHGDPPELIRPRPKCRGRMRGLGDARTVGTSKLSPP